MNDTNPSELLTVMHCPGCEQHSLVGDLKLTGHPSEDEGDQLACPRCGCGIGAVHFHDYAEISVVDYE